MYLANAAGALDQDVDLVNDVIVEAGEVPKQGLGRAFKKNLVNAARMAGERNYLKFIQGGGKVYQSDNMNAKVKDYVATIEQVLELGRQNLPPRDLIEGIMRVTGGSGSSMLATLKEKITSDPNKMDQLVEECELGKVSDEAITAAALSPVAALIEVVGQRETVHESLDYIQDLREANDPDKSKEERVRQNAVHVGTVHGWKGLEKNRVFTSMAQGIFPSKHALVTDKALRAERRLAYVAITRAAEQMVIYEPAKSVWGADTETSQFVEEACIPNFEANSAMEPPMPEEVGDGKTAQIYDPYLEYQWGDTVDHKKD
jgi:superfamily I DNA/RNA helicase